MRHWLKNQRSTLTFETYLAIVSLGLTYQVRIVTLAPTVLKNQLFKKKKKNKKNTHLNALVSKFELDV